MVLPGPVVPPAAGDGQQLVFGATQWRRTAARRLGQRRRLMAVDGDATKANGGATIGTTSGGRWRRRRDRANHPGGGDRSLDYRARRGDSGLWLTRLDGAIALWAATRWQHDGSSGMDCWGRGGGGNR